MINIVNLGGHCHSVSEKEKKPMKNNIKVRVFAANKLQNSLSNTLLAVLASLSLAEEFRGGKDGKEARKYMKALTYLQKAYDALYGKEEEE